MRSILVAVVAAWLTMIAPGVYAATPINHSVISVLQRVKISVIIRTARPRSDLQATCRR